MRIPTTSSTRWRQERAVICSNVPRVHRALHQLRVVVADVHAGGSPMSSHVARKVVQSYQRSQSDTADTSKLSPREREVLDLLARGYAFKEVSDALGISVTTVGTHIRRMYEKLHVHSRAQAVAAYTMSSERDELWRPPLQRPPSGK